MELFFLELHWLDLNEKNFYNNVDNLIKINGSSNILEFEKAH